MNHSFGVGAFLVAALSTLFLDNCSRRDPSVARLNREATSSGIETEIRQLHARQKFGPIIVTGKKFEELYNPWFHAVYEIAPKVDGGMKMAPHGVIRGAIAEREEPATINLTGRSPLEALDLICESFDAYFAYNIENSSVVVAATKDELKQSFAATVDPTERDPFAPAEEAAVKHGDAGHPSTCPVPKSGGGDKPQPTPEGHTR